MIPVTVRVTSYRPSLDKMLMTLRSILLQEGIEYQIVVTDDGSEHNLFPQVEKFLQDHGCRDYKLIANPVNRGIVENVLSGVKVSKGKWSKGISPGDCLYGEHALRDWVSDAESNHSVISFCDCVHYCKYDKQIKIIKVPAHPQNIKKYIRGEPSLRNAYLLDNDICIGAGMLVQTQKFNQYLEILSGHVTYAEDNSYRLMLAAGESASWFSGHPVLYENGTGISTSKEKRKYWSPIIRKDWLAANALIKARLDLSKEFDRKLLQRMDYDEKIVTTNSKIIWYLFHFAEFKNKLSQKFRNKRLSPDDNKNEFIKKLL